jgi:hypothetical protein
MASRSRTGARCIVKRIALTLDQIRQYDPPPNPVKADDSRTGGYVEKYGEECWELDALDPIVLEAIIEEAIGAEIDEDAWDEVDAHEAMIRKKLRRYDRRFEQAVEEVKAKIEAEGAIDWEDDDEEDDDE